MHKVAGKGAIATTKSPSIRAEAVPKGVTVQRIFGTTLKDNAVGWVVYVDFFCPRLSSRVILCRARLLLLWGRDWRRCRMQLM